MLGSLTGSGVFSAYDVQLLRTMWSDFMKAFGFMLEEPEQDAGYWVAALIYNFVKLNEVYTFTDKQIARICHAEDEELLQQSIGAVKEALRLEPHDPRYVNEEGLLLMLMQ